jgi:phosphoribosylamine--glycine ligase
MATNLKVLVVGSGGREHALAIRLLESDSVSEVVCCPGNAGTAAAPRDLSHKVLRNDPAEPLSAARASEVDLVVIGPEVPLCDGLADRIRAANIPCFGPSKKAAELEGSKATMKAFCHRHGIRTAREVVVEHLDALESALSSFVAPPVVKADGLCAGKGVVVAESFADAREAAIGMLSGRSFGVAGAKVVLEERILGEEASIHAICDGDRAFVLPAAQDHKRIFEGDRGPNTGGMGTYAPAPLVGAELFRRIESEIVQRAVRGMKKDGMPFIGSLFVGIMIDEAGVPVVLEFNVRFGDPETQVLTMITEGDFGEALLGAALGQLSSDCLAVSDKHALCVVLAAEDYPGTPRKGDPISGLEEAAEMADVRVFHAGTAFAEGEAVVTAGGRVLGVTARGDSLEEARDLAYRAADKITFSGRQLRSDLGYRALRHRGAEEAK